MRKRRGTLLLTCLFVAAAAASCGGGGRPNKLVGKWRPAGNADNAIEFKSDGTLVASDGQTVAKSKYEIEGENRVKVTALDAEGPTEPVVWWFELSGDGKTMRFGVDGGSRGTGTFERVE